MLGNHRYLMMENHGILVGVETLVLARGLIFDLERACINYLTTPSVGSPLSILSDKVAEKMA